LPFSAGQQTIGSISSVPGLIEFNEPRLRDELRSANWGGWSPGYSTGYLGKIFRRRGRKLDPCQLPDGYDVIFDNLYILSLPPQANQTKDVGSKFSGIPASQTLHCQRRSFRQP
jgi:hypothetical protein